jgi:uncharacterized protein (TIGR03435 family)
MTCVSSTSPSVTQLNRRAAHAVVPSANLGILGRGGTVRYAVAVTALSLSIPLTAQNQTAEPRFEVVSIKLHTGPVTSDPPAPPGVLRRTYATVGALVRYAFDVDDYQVINMPAWGNAEHFDVEAKASSGTAPDMPAMTRSLLRERFRLQTHRETRQGTTYTLMLSSAKGELGPGLKPSADDCKSRVAPPSNVPAGAVASFTCSGADQFARFISRILRAPVVNKTSLSGFWEFVLFYTPDGTALVQATGAVDTIAPHLTTALQEQLRLKLEPSRGALDVLVIDHIERPTEN